MAWQISFAQDSLKLMLPIGHTDYVNSVSFSPDGKTFISDSKDKTIKLWDIATGKELKTFEGHTTGIHSVSFSPDGKTFISGSGDNTIKIWDIATGKELKTFKGHTDYVNSVSFSPDGKTFISGSADKTIKLWDIATGKELCTMIAVDENDWLVATSDGRFDGSEAAMDMLYYVKGMEVIPLSSMYDQFYTPNLLARILAGEEFDAPQIDINNLTLPPLVKITSPTTQGDLRGFVPVGNDVLKAPTQQIEVTVQATDQGGGIDEIRLYLNGKLVQSTQRGFVPVVQNNQTKTQTFTVQLTNGQNIIRATAFNNQRTESLGDKITIQYDGQQATSDLYLLVVGINQYLNTQHNLNYAVADATSFKEVIETNTSTIFGNVNVTFLTDQDATKDKITQAFQTIQANSKQEDVFIFYYAGHGAMSVEDNPMFYMIPHDVTQLYGNNTMLQDKAISADELKDFSMELPAQKQLFVFDACQSGGVGDIVMRGNAEEKAIAVLARSTGTYWLTASGSDQFATEFAQIGHGVFTYALLLGLQGGADGSQDKQVTIKELEAFVHLKVPELSNLYKGQSQFPKSYGGGDNFPLVIIK